MILQCPNCRARFIVADLLIPPEGRTVKCGKCSHQWFTMHEGPVAAPPLEPSELTADHLPPTEPDLTTGRLPEDDFAAMARAAYGQAQDEDESGTASGRTGAPTIARLPVVARPRLSLLPFQIAAPVLAVAWVILALFAYFPGAQHASAWRGFYAALGATDTSKLVFEDVAMERQPLEGRTRFLLTGAIANQAEEARIVPQVRVQLKDAQGKVIWSQNYAVNQEVAPGERYPFRIENVETAFADRAASIVVDLGNSFEMVMR